LDALQALGAGRLQAEDVEVDVAVLDVEGRLVDVIGAEGNGVDGRADRRFLGEDRLRLAGEQRDQRRREPKGRRALEELTPGEAPGAQVRE
jgi:hypothetical protein